MNGPGVVDLLGSGPQDANSSGTTIAASAIRGPYALHRKLSSPSLS